MKNIIATIVIVLAVFSGWGQTTILSETLTSGSLPSGWSQTSVTFTTSSGGYANFTSSGSLLITSTFDASTYCNITVSFDVAKYGTGTDGPLTIQYSLDGGTTWLTAGTSSTPTSSTYISDVITISSVSANMLIRFNRSSSSSQKRLKNVVITGYGSCGSSNTVTTGTVSTSPFTVGCSTTTAGSVAFTSSGTFTSGNVYTAQLSDASGSFSSPVSIGTLASTANSGTISITIPAGTISGTGYKIRVISSSPTVTGSESAAFTVTLSGGSCVMTPPYLSSIIYDGCNTGSCNEGESEIAFGNTGSYSLNVSTGNIQINYPGSPTYNLVGTIVNNSATTASINSSAGCSGLFLDGYGQTLPPNTKFVIVPSGICLSVLTWSDLCGSGPIYIIYGLSGTSGNTWYTNGNFGNTGGVKTFQVVITTTDASVHSASYQYTAPSSGSNGNYATWSSSGGNAATQGNFPSCRLSVAALPTGLSYFKGYNDEQQNILVWETESEQNNSHFSVYHSADGFEYELMATISGAGNSSEKLVYQLADEYPRPGVNYYKLFSTDFDGTTYYKGIVAVETDLNTVYYNQFTKSVELPEKENVEIYSPEGKLMTASSEVNSIPFNHSGVFLVRFLRTGKTVRIFIP